MERNEILVSYNVKNLYPSIPIDKALELVERLLNEDEDLGETTTMSVTSKCAFPAHFDIIYTSCNDHDTSCAVTKLNN